MKQIFIAIFSCLLFVETCMASCDWSTIKPQGDSFLYSKSCHLEVGKLVEESKLRDQEVAKLNETIKLKDLALDTADQRINKWRDTAYSLDDRISKEAKYESLTRWGYIGMGVMMTVLSGWAIGQVKK